MVQRMKRLCYVKRGSVCAHSPVLRPTPSARRSLNQTHFLWMLPWQHIFLHLTVFPTTPSLRACPVPHWEPNHRTQPDAQGTNVAEVSSGLMSPPDSSCISAVLLRDPICPSVSPLCQSWVTHYHFSSVMWRWQTKECYFFPFQKLLCHFISSSNT